MSITRDGSAFLVSVPAANITRVLGNDCASCQTGNGTNMIKPAFTSIGNASSTLPANVINVATTKDTLTVTINNGYNFDPLRPSATARGTLVITAKSNGVVVALDSVKGATTAMPAGQVLVRKLPVSGAVSGATGIQVATNLDSPASDTAIYMDASRTVNFVASVGNNFYVSSANVSVSNVPISAAATNLDLSTIGSGISDHVKGGSLRLTVTNPFTVGGNLSVKLTGNGVNLNKPVTLGASASGAVSTIDFSAAELQSMFGQQVSLTISGSVSQTGSSVSVQPDQTVAIGTRLIVDVNTGSK